MNYVTQYYKNLSEQLQHKVNNLNKKLKYLRENGPIISDGNQGQGQGQGQGSITASRPLFGPGGYFTPFWPESQEPTFSPRPPWSYPPKPPQEFPIPSPNSGESFSEYLSRLRRQFGGLIERKFIDEMASEVYNYHQRYRNPRVPFQR